MRALLWFLLAIAAAIVLASLVAYPAWLVLHPLVPAWRIDKIAGRAFDLFVLLAILAVMRRLDLGNRRAWGFGLPLRTGLRHFGAGLAAGVATMLPVTFAMVALGARTPRPEFSGAMLGQALLVGIGSGLAVALLEEPLFRGLIQGAVIRESRRPALGIVLVAILFAAMHFLADATIPNEAVTPASGLRLLATVADHWLSPASIADGFAALFAVGLLMGLVTWWSGSVALSIGLHCGWVWMMRTTLITTRLDEHAGSAWLIYRGHGYVGWLTFGWTLVLLGLVISNRRRWSRWRDPSASLVRR
jgi:membrane protease YdiL (CAAX protease family)